MLGSDFSSNSKVCYPTIINWARVRIFMLFYGHKWSPHFHHHVLQEDIDPFFFFLVRKKIFFFFGQGSERRYRPYTLPLHCCWNWLRLPGLGQSWFSTRAGPILGLTEFGLGWIELTMNWSTKWTIVMQLIMLLKLISRLMTKNLNRMPRPPKKKRSYQKKNVFWD